MQCLHKFYVAKKSHSAKVKLSKVGKMAELESHLCCSFPQTPVSAAGAGCRLCGTAVSQHFPFVRLEVVTCQSTDVRFQKQSTTVFDEVELLTLVEPEELFTMCGLRLSMLRYFSFLITRLATRARRLLTHRLHASVLTGCVSCPVSPVSVYVRGVGKCRALVSGLKQYLVRGQEWCLAS